MKLNFSLIFQCCWALAAAQTVASEETSNIAEIASALPDFSILVGFVSLNDPNIQPILARLTGDIPTSTFTTDFRITDEVLCRLLCVS
jgi:hypothetical protein